MCFCICSHGSRGAARLCGPLAGPLADADSRWSGRSTLNTRGLFCPGLSSAAPVCKGHWSARTSDKASACDAGPLVGCSVRARRTVTCAGLWDVAAGLGAEKAASAANRAELGPALFGLARPNPFLLKKDMWGHEECSVPALCAVVPVRPITQVNAAGKGAGCGPLVGCSLFQPRLSPASAACFWFLFLLAVQGGSKPALAAATTWRPRLSSTADAARACCQ